MNDNEEESQAVNENENEEPSQCVNENKNEEASPIVNENEKPNNEGPIEDLNQMENEEDNEIVSEDAQTAYSSEEFVFPFDIDDPGNWNKTDQNIRDFLVERGPKRDNNVIFPKNHSDRCFAMKHYFRDLPNREKQDRKWLVYSVSLDKVFGFAVNCFQKSI